MIVFNESNKPVGLLVSPYMNAREACHKLLLLNKEEDGPHWVLVEHLTDLGLGEYYTDSVGSTYVPKAIIFILTK